ncbi:MAG: hypothetical protein WB424_19210, partial [Terracidiphilus sp.]
MKFGTIAGWALVATFSLVTLATLAAQDEPPVYHAPKPVKPQPVKPPPAKPQPVKQTPTILVSCD